jgi:hypothetical protein
MRAGTTNSSLTARCLGGRCRFETCIEVFLVLVFSVPEGSCWKHEGVLDSVEDRSLILQWWWHSEVRMRTQLDGPGADK